MQTFAESYINETLQLLKEIDCNEIERFVEVLRREAQSGGRVFLAGVGGSAAACSHAASDLIKLCEIDARCMDNMAQFSALANDAGMNEVFVQWLEMNSFYSGDLLIIVSVGGGTEWLSRCLVRAMEYAKKNGGTICSIVGRDGGKAKEMSDVCVMVPYKYPERVTPHTEGIHSVILHLLVTHPSINRNHPAWESLCR